MRYLILSDIHANREALQAVMEHAAGKYDLVVCCGDIIGYGADPNAVTEWVRANVAVVIRGNHDKASTGLEDLEWFNPAAREASVWTMNHLEPGNADYVRHLPKGPLPVDGFQILHGSPLDEDEYLVGIGDAGQAFPYLDRPVTFFGHTHVQGGFVWTTTRIEPIKAPMQTGEKRMEVDPERVYLLNPGSVGQPRDGDARASYAVYDSEAKVLNYFRVIYDVEGAQTKIRKAGLPELLAARLAIGR